MLNVKRDFNQHDFEVADLILNNLSNFQPLEVVNRVSETQFPVGR